MWRRRRPLSDALEAAAAARVANTEAMEHLTRAVISREEAQAGLDSLKAAAETLRANLAELERLIVQLTPEKVAEIVNGS